MANYKFDCGCSIPIYGNSTKEFNGLLPLELDYRNINLNCPITWKIFEEGNTKGVFQLETQLGKTWSKKIKPTSIDEIAALISLIRPGCLRAIVDGKSMTQHYADRKAGLEEVTYFHEALRNILKDTYGILTYQEQSMKIATDLAGFNLQEADSLRKAIGKKLPELMSKIEKEFSAKAKGFGVINEDECNSIFGWIRESQRYSFNKSHAATYGKIAYWTAYVKAHFPLHFYTSWLYFARDRQFYQEEIEELVDDALTLGILINPPSLKLATGENDVTHFLLHDKNIYFGIGDIKGIGDSNVGKIVNAVREVECKINKPISEWTWNDFLLRYSNSLSTTSINGLISSGATDYITGGMSRGTKCFEYNNFKELNSRERGIIQDDLTINTLADGIKKLINDPSCKVSPKRIKHLTDILKSLQNASFKTEDSVESIIKSEQEMLGVVLTCSRLDACMSVANTRCEEILNGKTGKVSVAVEILSVRKHIIKNGASKGQTMAFLKAKDTSSILESVILFSDKWEQYKPLLYKGNTILIDGTSSKRNGEISLIVNEVSQI